MANRRKIVDVTLLILTALGVTLGAVGIFLLSEIFGLGSAFPVFVFWTVFLFVALGTAGRKELQSRLKHERLRTKMPIGVAVAAVAFTHCSVVALLVIRNAVDWRMWQWTIFGFIEVALIGTILEYAYRQSVS